MNAKQNKERTIQATNKKKTKKEKEVVNKSNTQEKKSKFYF